MSKIKILVLDENAEFRASLEQYTYTVPEIHFLGVRTDVEDIIKNAEEEVPDLVLYASALIAANGESQLMELRDKWPRALYYRLTVFDDSGLDDFDYVKGFDGSVSRSNIDEHLTAIIETFQCSKER